MKNILDAILAGDTTSAEYAALELPESYRGVTVHKDEVDLFEGVETRDKDPRKSLHVDEANEKLAVKARRIISILERLNVSVLTAEHDYLGQLYETFFRYAGGNTIGQYFTPRHVASLCADMLEVCRDDIVLDPTCGTGGFLIEALTEMRALLQSLGLEGSGA